MPLRIVNYSGLFFISINFCSEQIEKKMKIINLFIPYLLVLFLGSCKKEEIKLQQDYIFVKPLCEMVTVGGFVGIAEKCFKIGDIVTGEKTSEGTIIIRIAEHSYLNDGKPNSYSYQEFLEVSSEYLELVTK